MKAQEKIASIVHWLRSYPFISKIYLFGSRARGDASFCSDIDMALEYDKKLSFRDKRKIQEKIEELSGLYSVDIVYLDEIDKNFKRKIIQEGKKLYEKE